MESLHTLNLGNNLIEEFSMPLITEWFTAESGADDVQEPKETQKSSNFRLILNENPVSTEIISVRCILLMGSCISKS